MTAAGGSRSTRSTLPRSLWFRSGALVTASALCASFLGCMSMTTAKMEKLTEELEQRLAAVREEEAARRESEEGRLKEEQARRDRADKARIAEERLASGDAPGALRQVEEILAPVMTASKDPNTNQETRAAVKPLGMDAVEESRLLTLKGNILAELQRLDEAILTYQKALELDGTQRTARRNLGRTFFTTRRFKQALQTWGPELALGWRDGDLLLLVGQARYEVGRAESSPEDLEAARIAFEQVLLERPDNTESIQALATIAFESGRFADAEHYFNLWRRQSPLDGDALEKLGRAALAQGKQESALDYLELAANLKLPSPDLCLTLSRLYSSLHFDGRAAEFLARAYKNNPAEAPPEERWRAGTLFVQAGKNDEALPWLSAVSESEQHFAASHGLLVRALAATGRHDEALAAYEKLRKFTLQDGASHLLAGELYLRRKQLDLAAAAFSKASAFGDSKAESLAGLAEVFLANRNLESALLYYRKALEARPGSARFLAAANQIGDELSSRSASSGSTAGAPSSGGQ